MINPSFEGEPADATTPQGWHPCDDMTTPDIFPGYWGVYNEPSDGNTYVGIITRENGTFESFGQRFSSPLEKGRCYMTAIDLAHSSIYSGYNKPIKLRIYISGNQCGRDQLIFQSEEVSKMSWATYKIEFVPQNNYKFLIIEAFYKKGDHPWKGNILIDNLRSFIVCGTA